MISVGKQCNSCFGCLTSDHWGKDFLILMEKRALGWRRSALAFTHVRLRPPERFVTCGDDVPESK